MFQRFGLRASLVCIFVLQGACGTGGNPPSAAAGVAGSSAPAAPAPWALEPDPDASLCAKYGGLDSVRQVTAELLAKITGDCRIRAFFAGLTRAGGQRVLDCLSLQIAELFGCPGLSYAQARADNGLECRDMRKSHIGLGITSADFDALVQDVGLGLAAAGIDAADIQNAASALAALAPQIVELPSSALPSRSECAASEAPGPELPEPAP